MAEVVTTGNGEVEQLADEAGLRLRYSSRARDRGNAVNELTKQTKTVEPLLDRAGVTVRSRQLYVFDTWEGRRRTGGQANQNYSVLVTDVTVLNDLLGDLIATEPTELSGPMWSLSDRTKSFREAQRLAVADARDKAQGYADALGWRLGTLLRVDDSSAGHIRPMAFAAGDAVALSRSARPYVPDLSLEPQYVSVTAMCTITWEVLV